MKKGFSISLIFVAIVISALFIAHCGSGGGDTGQSYWQGGSGGGTTPTPTPTSTIPVISTINTEAGGNAAFGGEQIVIVGSSFGSSTRANPGTVSFNGVEATDILSWENDAITCLVPIMACSGPISVTRDGVTSNTDINFVRLKKLRGSVGLDWNGDAWAGHPHVAGSPYGDAMAVWVHGDTSSRSRTYASHYDPQTDTWSDAVCIDPDAGGATTTGYQGFPVFDSNGNCVVVMKTCNGNPEPYEAFANVWNRETNTWSGTTQITNYAELEPLGQIYLKASPTGQVMAAWRHRTGSADQRVYAVVYDSASGTWGTPTTVDPGTPGSDYCPGSVAFDGSGNAMVTIQNYNVTPEQIFVNRYDQASGTWAGAVQVTNLVGNWDARKAKLAMESSGKAMLCYKAEDNATSNDFIYAIYYDGSAWGTPQLLSTTPAWACANEIVVDNSGNYIATFKQYDGDNDETMHACRFDAATQSWSAPVAIEDTSITGWDDQRNSLGIDPCNGNAISMWNRDRVAIFVSIFDASSGTWSAPKLIGEGCYNKTAYDPAGNMTMIFENYNSDTIHAIRYY